MGQLYGLSVVADAGHHYRPKSPKISLDLEMRYTVNGKVNLRGTFHGCAEPRRGAGYGVLTVMATSPVRMGGSVGAPICAQANYCTKTVAIPFSGTKTYCGHVSFQDDGHFRRWGRDPYLHVCAEVSR